MDRADRCKHLLGSRRIDIRLLTAAIRDALGVNPLEIMVCHPRHRTLGLLLVILTLAPLRQALAQIAIWRRASCSKQFSDWNWLMRVRRTIGIAAYFYRVIHVQMYVILDLDSNWQEAWVDLRDKPFMLAGAISLLLLALLHVVLLSKPGSDDDVVYGVPLLVLLLWRIARGHGHQPVNTVQPDGTVPERNADLIGPSSRPIDFPST